MWMRSWQVRVPAWKLARIVQLEELLKCLEAQGRHKKHLEAQTTEDRRQSADDDTLKIMKIHYELDIWTIRNAYFN